MTINYNNSQKKTKNNHKIDVKTTKYDEKTSKTGKNNQEN